MLLFLLSIVYYFFNYFEYNEMRYIKRPSISSENKENLSSNQSTR